MEYNLRISGIHLDLIKNHLFPGDNFEAIAMALCGRLETRIGTTFLIHKVIPIPYQDCERGELSLFWKTDSIYDALLEAERKNYTVLKIHSHPTGISSFSETDDISDYKFFDCVFGWTLNANYHVSCIMLPDGRIIARTINESLQFEHIHKISIIGDDCSFHWAELTDKPYSSTDVDLRNIQTFGNGTISILKKLSVSVIGCSGTGSIVVEQLARLGVGKIVLVDPDKVEKKNLNRILNATLKDAIENRYKVDVLRDAIMSFGFNTEVSIHRINLYDDKDAIKEVAGTDVIFGCVDSADGRYLINLISNYYITPLIDVGVRIDADGLGGIESINGSIHFIQPGKSSLLTRRVYSPEQLQAAGLFRKNPEMYASMKKDKYVKNIAVDSPAVISINMLFASIAVNDFLARVHRFRIQENKECAIQRFTLSDPYFQNESADIEDPILGKSIGLGDVYPLLNNPEFS